MSQPSDATDFIAFIPQQIDPSWHPEWGPKLAGLSGESRLLQGPGTPMLEQIWNR